MSVIWAAGDTIFPKVRALGLNTGLAGFFLPYCPILGDTLTTCTWEPCVTCGRLTGVFGKSVGESMWHQVSELVPRYDRRRHLATFRGVQEAGLALAADPTIGMAVIHLGVPHDPVIYDRRRGDYSLRAVEGDGYLHNLALVDRSLGELRDAMETAGLWDRTTVIVLGDHGRRSPDNGMTIARPACAVHCQAGGRVGRRDVHRTSGPAPRARPDARDPGGARHHDRSTHGVVSVFRMNAEPDQPDKLTRST